MSTVTGIELGPDYCVLVRARRRGAAIEVTAVRIFEPDEWPADPAARSERLRDARRVLGLPRHATVVAWDLAAFGVNSSEAMLRAAGFTVENVLSPSDALALLAWSRPRADPFVPLAWLSINRHGAGLAVVRDHELLYGREFAWRIKASEQRAQAHLLRRYLYVAQIVPELRKAMDVVREQQGARIETAVACGNIPDLRSFTMPLIDQLDIEFETLDSLEGLSVKSEMAGAIAPSAPLIRLAGAAAAFGESGGVTGPSVRWLGAAAGLVLAAGAAWWAFSIWGGSPASPDRPPRDRTPIVSAQGRRSAPAAAANDREPRSDQAASSATALEARTGAAAPQEGAQTARSSRASAPAAVEEPPQPQPTTGRVGDTAARAGRNALQSPLPTVGGILISQNTRLAVIDGVVVAVGDSVGERVVARIDADAVVFREPSGREIRVTVRSRSQP